MTDNFIQIGFAKLKPFLQNGNTGDVFEILLYLSSSQQTREVFRALEKEIDDFYDKFANNELTEEEKEKVKNAFLIYTDEVSESKIQEDRDFRQSIAIIDQEFKDVPPATKKEISQKQQTFINSLVDNYIKNSKISLTEDQQKKIRENVSKNIQTKQEKNVFATSNDIVETVQTEFHNTSRALHIDPALIVSFKEIDEKEIVSQYEDLNHTIANRLARTNITSLITSDVPPKNLDFLIQATRQEFTANPNSRKNSSFAAASARTAGVLLADNPLETFPQKPWQQPGLKSISPVARSAAVISTVKKGVNDLVVNNELLTRLGISSAPLIQQLARISMRNASQNAQSSAGLSSAITGLSNIVNDVVGSVSKSQEEKSGTGAFLMIRGLGLLKNKKLPPWMFFINNEDFEIGNESILLKLWLLSASKIDTADFINFVSTQDGKNTLEQQSNKSGFYKNLLTDPDKTIKQLKNSASLGENKKIWASLLMSQIYGAKGDFLFTKLTGLQYVGTSFRIASGTLSQADAAFLTLKNAGSILGKNSLSQLAILAKTIRNPLSLAAFSLGSLGGFINRLTGSPIKQRKKKTDWETWIIIGIVCVILGLLLFGDSTQSLTRKNIATSLGGSDRTDSSSFSGSLSGCFSFNNTVVPFNDGMTRFTSPWNASDMSSLSSATQAISSSSKFLSLLCANGSPISLYRSVANVNYGGFTMGASEFVLYDAGVSSALYTIAHETGHIIIKRNPGLFRSFLDSVPIKDETSVPCSYTASLNKYNYASEAFAEMVALFIMQQSGRQSFSCYGSGESFRFETRYPDLWNFAKNYIF